MVVPIGVVAGHEAERLEYQAALARSEARFNALVEASDQLLWRIGPDGRALEISPAWARYTGWSVEELAAGDWIELIHPDDREKIRQTYRQMLVVPCRTETNYRIRRSDGAYRRFNLRTVPVQAAGGALQEIVCAWTDIEEQERAETARQEMVHALDLKSERLASILEALPVGVVLTEIPSGRVLQANQAFETLNPILEEQASDPLTAQLEAAALSPIVRAISEGKVVDGEEQRLVLADGSESWLQLSAVPLRDASGTVVASLGTLIDINPRKRVEVALRESERHIRFCLENISQHVWIARTDGSPEYLSPRWYEYTGARQGDPGAESWVKYVHPDDIPACKEAWRHAVRSGGSYETEARLRGADGTYRWFLSRGEPMQDEDGTVVRWFGTNTDLHEKKGVREALRASEARFRRIFDLDLLGMCTWRLDGRILDANREFLRIVGHDRAALEAGTLDWRSMLPPDAREQDIRIGRELRLMGSIRPVERECLGADGSRVPVILTAALDHSGAEQGTAFLFDASARQRLEEFQHQLIGVVGHDLRSPLAAMITTVSVLLRNQNLGPAERKSIERIRGSAERMRRITRDLIDYTEARVGHGLTTLIEEADLAAICRGATEEARLLAPGRLISSEGPADARLRCDMARIEQALSNLLMNAIKYGDGAIELRWMLEEDRAVIEVENAGAPIDGALLPQLFTPFRPGRRRDAPVVQSLGLGLFIVREIAICHGGSAEVEQLEHGTLVRLILPAAGPPAAQSPPAEESSSARW